MKLLKWILIIVAVLVLLVVGGVTFILTNAGLQKSIVKGELEKHVEVKELGYFKAGLSELTIESLEIVKDGKVVTLDKAVVKYSVFDMLFGSEIRIDDLLVAGLVVDARSETLASAPTTPATPTETAPVPSEPKHPVAKQEHADDDDEDRDDEHEIEPFDFDGIFSKVPEVRVIVGTVSVEAKVYSNDGKEIDFKASGGGIGPGKQGELAMTIDFVDTAHGAQLSTATVKGKLAVTQDEAGAFNAIFATIDLEAESTQVEDAPGLNFVMDLKREASGVESYQLSLKESGQGSAPLLSVEASFNPETDILQGTGSLQAEHTQVAGLVDASTTPEFALKGELKFQGNTETHESSLTANLNLLLNELARVRDELAGLGQVEFVAELDAKADLDELTLSKADVSLNSSSQGKLLLVELLQTLKVPMQKGEKLPELEGELLRVSVNRLPFSLIEPWVPGMQLSGQPFTTQAVLSADDERYTLAFPQGLKVNNLSVVKDGQPMLDKLWIAVEGTATLDDEHMDLSLTDIRMLHDAVPFFQGKLAVRVPTKSKDGFAGTVRYELDGDLAILLKQPALIRYNNVAAGTVESAGTVDLGAKTIDLNLALKQLLLREPMKQISSLEFAAKGSIDYPREVDITAPLAAKSPEGNTDVTLTAKLSKPAETLNFDVKLEGPQLDADSLMLLATAFKNPQAPQVAASPAPSAPAPTAPSAKPAQTSPQKPSIPMGPGPVLLGPDGKPLPAPDAVPFWHGNKGTLSVKVDKLYYTSYRLDKATLLVKVEEAKLTVDPLSAEFTGAPLKADTVITFTQGSNNPYDLVSNLTFTEFDLGKFLVDGQRGKVAPVTGMFNVKGQATGQGPTMNVLMQQLQGAFNLEGRNGSLRMLASTPGGNEVGQALQGVAGIASLITGGENKQVNTISEITQLLQQLDYNRMTLDVKRGQDLNINLNEIALIGNQIKLTGNGVVTHVAGTSVTKQPLKAEMLLLAKGSTAEMFQEVKMLTDVQDSDGFYQAFRFPITGTLSSPNYDKLKERLGQAAVEFAQSLGKSNSGSETEESTEKKQSTGQKAINSIFNNLLK